MQAAFVQPKTKGEMDCGVLLLCYRNDSCYQSAVFLQRPLSRRLTKVPVENLSVSSVNSKSELQYFMHFKWKRVPRNSLS